MPRAPITHRDYYHRWIQSFWTDIFRLGKGQVLGALLAFAILLLQLKLGVVPHALARQAWASILWPYILLVAAVILASCLRTPVLVDRKRVEEISARDERIERLQTSLELATRQKEIPQVNFDFRLYSKPGPHIFMKMNYGYGGIDASVPFVGIAVSNKSERRIEVVACELAKVHQSNQMMIETDQLIGPMDSVDVDVTRRFIELVAELREPSWDKIFGTYQVEVAVECRAEKAERPVKAEPKIFDVEILRAGKSALEITISPHRS
jgi:hypothetical protein